MDKIAKRLIWAAFGLYCAVMLWLLFGQRLGADIPGTYWERLAKSVNLIPFHTIRDFMYTMGSTANPYLLRHSFINLVGNVVMFVPLGFFLPCILPKLRTIGRCLSGAAAIILTVELLQLFTLLGSCDVDDLILNMAGIAIGHGIYRLTARLYAK